MTITVKQLAAVEAEIAEIQPKANELMDRLQGLSRADGRALKASAEWQIVERWSELNLRRAKLRDELEIEDVIAHPDRYAE